MKLFIYLFVLMMTTFSCQSTKLRTPNQIPDVVSADEAKWWIKSNSELFKSIRENANHFWFWTKKNKDLYFKNVKLSEGIVAGDFHFNNYKDLPIYSATTTGEDLKNQFYLTDLDESGFGPFIFDFIRFATIVQTELAEFKITNKDLYQAYIDGRLNKKNNSPDYINEILNKKSKKIKERQTEFIAKPESFKSLVQVMKKNAKDSSDKLIQSMDQYFQKNESTFVKYISKGSQIKKVGYNYKKSGGSQFAERYIILSELDGLGHILEFKEVLPPATRHWATQKEDGLRIVDVQKQFWVAFRSPYFKVVQIDQKKFWLRERFNDYFNIMESDDVKNIIFAYAYILGQIHGKQNQYKLESESLSNSVVDRIVNDYIARAKQLNQ